MRRLVICGAGGFGREVVQIVASINVIEPTWDLVGVVDDAPGDVARAHLAARGIPLLGGVPRLAEHAAGGCAVVAIGDPRVRAGIVEAHPEVEWATLVHPDTTVGADVELGGGSVIAAGARLSTNIRVREHVQVDQNSTVGHDTDIGAFTRLNPQACISGSVQLGEGVLIGANATILQGLSAGDRAIVGAGAVVTRDIAAGLVVTGVPAR